MNETAFATATLASYGIAAVGYLAFSGRLVLRWRRSAKAALLLAAMLATAVWAMASVAVVLRPGLLPWLVASVGDTARYALWFVFADRILRSANGNDPNSKPLPLVPRSVLVVAAAMLAGSLVLPIGLASATSIDPQVRMWTFGLRAGLAVVGLIMVEQLMRRAHPEARWAIKPLCLGLGAVFAFDLYFFADAMLFKQFDQDIWLARGIANAVVIPLIAVASARNTGWTVDIHVSRSAVFHSTALLLSGVFVLAIAGAGYIVRYFGGEFGSAVQIAFSFAALLLAVLVVASGRFRSKLRVFVSKHFFSYRYDYREEWLRFTQTLSEESTVQSIEERCIKALADLVESPSGILWLKQEHDTFEPTTRWNAALPAAGVAAAASLPQFMLSSGWIVNVVEYTSHPSRYRDLALPEWLSSIQGAWLVVPLIPGSELIGFVVLTTPRAKVEVNWEVLDLLKTASRQAASYIGQARSTESLLESRKFAAFNRMSAFVVHDLKNLVSQLSLMLKNAERHRDNPEFQRDMVTTVAHVVGRMNHLMLQLRSDSTPPEKPRAIDLERLIRRVCVAKEPRAIALRLTPGLVALAHEDQLDHVLGHLVQNAMDATGNAGEVTVTLGRGAPPGTVVIEVSDTGVGMTPEFMRERLFKPFETTKASGMGIGVYESAQYIRGIGGAIDVRSQPGEGTVVRVTLPAADTGAESPLPHHQALT